jgi:hypothetical protein
MENKKDNIKKNIKYEAPKLFSIGPDLSAASCTGFGTCVLNCSSPTPPPPPPPCGCLFPGSFPCYSPGNTNCPGGGVPCPLGG